MTMAINKPTSMNTSRRVPFFLLCYPAICLVFGVVHAFVPTPTQKLSSSTSWTTAKLHAAITLQEIQLRLDTYEVAVPKPLGVIFGENSEPYLGLVVDDISEGMNGGKAGLRAGDQLIAVNGKVILGTDFDAAMSRLTDDSTSVLDLVMYRGPVRQMYTILGNQLEDGQTIASDGDDDDDDDEDSEAVIMDEDYESPVQIDISKYENKPLTAGDFVKAIGKLGSMLAETAARSPEDGNGDDEAPPKDKKKKAGFFGIGGETIQLDGEDAKF